MFYIIDGKTYLEEGAKLVPVDIEVTEEQTSYLPAGKAIDRPAVVGLPLTLAEVAAKAPARPEPKPEPEKKAPAKRRPAKRAPAKKTSK